MNHEITAKRVLESHLGLLQPHGIKVSEPVRSGYCYEADLQQGSEKAKIRVYFSSKGVKTVVQGNKQTSLLKKTEELIFGQKLFETDDVEITEPGEYIGTDESGKGDYFGPLVIAGVVSNDTVKDELKRIGVKDSKLLSENTITSLSQEIKRIVGDNSAIVFISPARYNELYTKFGNLNRLLAWGHSRVIENLLEKNIVKTAVSDKFGDESLIRNSLLEKGKGIDLFQYHKAEKYTAVAAASILARNEVNKWFIREGKKLNINLPKGASEAVDKTAGDLVKKFGPDILQQIAKVHFKTTKKFLG